jgi:hypothetical protein
VSETFRRGGHDGLDGPGSAVERTETRMRTQDGEDVVGAPHRAAQDDRRVGDVKSVVERFVVFYVTHVDAEEGRRDVDLLTVEDEDGWK